MEDPKNAAERPSVGTLEAIEIEELLLALARIRGRLKPAPTACDVETLVKRMRRLMLAGE